jgi:predicted RNA-binding protein with EMAP domain
MNEHAFEAVPGTNVVAQEVLRRGNKPLADKLIVPIVCGRRQRGKPFCYL